MEVLLANEYGFCFGVERAVEMVEDVRPPFFVAVNDHFGIRSRPETVTALLELQQYYKQGGGAKTDGLLKSLLGREPVTLDQYLNANAREFRDQAASA